MDEAPTSIFPPSAEHDLPSFPFEEGVPDSRAIVVRERVTLPPTIIVRAPVYPPYVPPPSMFAVALGWLWDNPTQRTWRVAAAAGTFALLLGFGVAAGRGARLKAEARAVTPATRPVASEAPPPHGVDPATLPVADEAPARTRQASALRVAPQEQPLALAQPAAPTQAAPIRVESLPTAAPPKPRAVPTSEKPVVAEHVIDLDATENPYSKTQPKPVATAQAAATPPRDPAVPAVCRQPYTIDAQGIRRVKPECL